MKLQPNIAKEFNEFSKNYLDDMVKIVPYYLQLLKHFTVDIFQDKTLIFYHYFQIHIIRFWMPQTKCWKFVKCNLDCKTKPMSPPIFSIMSFKINVLTWWLRGSAYIIVLPKTNRNFLKAFLNH